MIDVSRDDDVGRELRRVAKDLRHQDAPLAVDRAVLAVVVDAFEELRLGAVDRRRGTAK